MLSYPRAPRLLAALLLGVCAAFLVACGAGTKRGIPAADAQQLNSDLNALVSAVNAGDCAQADAAITKVKGDVLELPASVNRRLRDRLATGANNLARRAPTECAQNAQTTPSDTTPTTTTPTTTTPTTTETTPTTTDTTPTTTTPTTTDTTPTTTTPTTTTTTPTTTTPTTPGGTGGTGGSGGSSGGSGGNGGTSSPRSSGSGSGATGGTGAGG